MRTTTRLWIAVGLVGLYGAGHTVAGQRAARPLTIDHLVEIKHPSNGLWSPDGKQVLFTWDRAGVSRAYLADAGGGSAPRDLGVDPATLLTAPWSADGRSLYATRGGDLWRIPVDGSAAAAVWTTPQPETAIVLSPDATRAAFIRGSGQGRGRGSQAAGGPAPATGGQARNETKSEIWIRTLTDGAETRVAAVDSAIGGLSWSPDARYLTFTAGADTIRHEQTPAYSGAKIIYTITERVPGTSYVVPVAGGTPVAIGGPRGGGALRWLDGATLLYDRTSPDFKTRGIYAAPLAGGDPTLLREDRDEKFWSITGDAGAGSQVSPDGKWIAFLSDRDGWDHLYVMPAAGGAAVQITKGAFEAWRPVWAPDSRRLAFDANGAGAPGTRHLGIADLGTDPAKATVTMITEGRGTNIAPRWSPDGTRLLYQHTDPQNSADLFVISAAATAAKATPVRLTDSMPSGIDRAAFVAPERVSYPGPDGQPITAWLFTPKNLDKSRKHPAIVWIHGDGVNQGYDGWHVQRNYAVYYSFHQYLLQQGYVVIAPDYRGSIGYGKAWRQGVYMDVGGNDAKDAWMAANYLRSVPYVDVDRVGVWGLSYGGFFTLIAMTDQPRLFRCGIDVAGVVDYAMYYEDPYHGGWTASRIGTPEQNPAVYAKASPISHIARLERPLLVLHGTSDVNVPYLHSVRLVDEALKGGKGGLLEFMTYPGEFHYFTREHVLRDAWMRSAAFFDRHLRTAPAPRTSEP